MATSPDVEHLLVHSDWLRVLARNLARDDSRADDLVQETWCFALEQPPRHDRNLGAWLGRVLRGRKRDTERSEYRRRLRERRAGRREAQISDLADAVDRAELQRELVSLILRLEECYRDAVLLRYFEGLSPGEIARFEKVPVSTVHTRLRRALEKLRRGLDRTRGGDRRAWIALLGAPATAVGPPVEGGSMSGAVAEATAPSTTSGSPPVDLTPVIIAGGIAMSSKKVLLWAAVGVLAALGFSGSLFWSPEESAAPDSRAPLATVEPPRVPESSPRPDATGVPVAGDTSTADPATVTGGGETGTIRGRVRDRAGSPVAAVRVRAFRLTDKATYFNEETEIEGDTESDENGGFELAALPVGVYFVRGMSEEHRPSEVRDLEVTPSGLLEVELEVRRGLAISGWVIDPFGRPVAGAKVTSTEAPSLPFFLEPRSDIAGWAVEELSVMSDENGRFLITRLPSGNRRVVAHHPDWGTWDQVVAAGSEDLRITVRAGATIRGRLIDASGEPVPLAAVGVARWSERSWPESYKTDGKTTSDEDGFFYLEHLVPGLIELTVETEGYPPLRSGELEVREDETIEGVVLALAEPARVTGTVVDSAGERVSGAQVEAQQVTGHSRSSRAASDENGTFTLGPLEAGAEHRISFEHSDFCTRRFDPFVTERGENDIGTVTLESGGTLSGVVLDARLAPLAGVEVVLQQNKSRKALTVADGSFELRGLAPGECYVKAFLPGVAPATSERVVVSDGKEATVQVVVGGGSVSGRVIDDRGRPVPNAAVKVRQQYDDTQRFAEDDGHFTIGGLKEGELSIEARFRNLASKTHEGVTPGDVVELVLLQTAQLSGTIRDRATGKALTEFRVYLEKSSRRSSGSGIQFRHSLGRYVLDDLEPREYVLRVLAAGYVLEETSVELASGEMRRLDIELTRGENVAGRLVDRAGRPVIGASVFPVAPGEVGQPIRRFGGQFFTTRFDGMRYAESFLQPWAQEVTTDSDGRFVLSGMAPGPTLVRVEHGDFLFEDLPGFALPEGGLDLGTLRLERGSVLEGAVFDADGLPMRAASIAIDRLREDETEAHENTAYFQIESDGTFRKAGLRSGRYRLQVYGLEEIVDLRADETRRVEFHLPERK